MTKRPNKTPGISRRSLLGAGAAAVTSAAAGAAALPASSIGGWDLTTDVLVAGSGAAGMCAALEAAAAGSRVMVIESLGQAGGSSAMSGGVIYAGGGTALQKSHKIEDSVVEMYRFLKDVSGAGVSLPKVQLYCEESVAHFDWLLQQGVPYGGGFTAAKGLPEGEESLYYSGTELAWPARDLARPAPRGHVPGVRGMNGGRKLMEALFARGEAAGIRVRTRTSGQHLVTESDGRVVGMLVEDGAGRRQRIRAQRGVVLACGGFIHNREMLELYAPELAAASVPWGNAGDQGQGINMGISAGAAALRMHEGFAIAPIYPPEHTLAGLVINQVGQRFVAEDAYHGVLGHHIAYHQSGKAWLITDQFSTFGYKQDNFPMVAQANSVGDLADQLRLPRGSLQNTVAYFNRFAARGEDPLFRKSNAFLRPLQAPPFQAWDLSVDKAFFPVHTFGGLHTSVDGEVISSFGEPIPGLYAAGRNTAGLPTAPYIASGLSLGDATFFGRRAGRAAAGVST
ncbi:FAD-dependent oxidoreductase [Halioglobus maricola]|uniref:FAD-dependent oxidoreductase n=1 Tax=Halioglobus maricola TaxID=2601894 RepID=UPI0014786DE0|nr:FAD-dependent oxidoreductase [Halioglobus maricola]